MATWDVKTLAKEVSARHAAHGASLLRVESDDPPSCKFLVLGAPSILPGRNVPPVAIRRLLYGKDTGRAGIWLVYTWYNPEGDESYLAEAVGTNRLKVAEKLAADGNRTIVKTNG